MSNSIYEDWFNSVYNYETQEEMQKRLRREEELTCQKAKAAREKEEAIFRQRIGISETIQVTYNEKKPLSKKEQKELEQEKERDLELWCNRYDAHRQSELEDAIEIKR